VSAIEQELKGLTTKQLLAKFREFLAGATEGFVRACVCYKILDGRGAKVPGVTRAGAKTYLAIASGRIDPIVFLQFLKSPIRQYIEQIPVEAQRELAENPVIDVIESTTDGKCESKPIDIRNLRTPAEAEQFARKALGDKGVLSIDEQIKRVEQERKTSLESNANRYDPDRFYRRVSVSLSNREYNAIKLKADRQGTTEGDILHRYAMMSGAFSEEVKKTHRPRATATSSARP
jgi:hypothetical protein